MPLVAPVRGVALLSAAPLANVFYEDHDSDYFYVGPGLTLFRAWLAVAPAMVFGDTIGDWWKTVGADRYLKYQTSL